MSIPVTHPAKIVEKSKILKIYQIVCPKTKERQNANKRMNESITKLCTEKGSFFT
jgi:hypothetical protein